MKFRNIDFDDWSKSWKSSKQPRKQRKYLLNAPLHIRRKIISSRLDDKIREIIKIKSLPVIVGDYVRIIRGDEEIKNKEGYVVYVDTKRYRVYVDVAKYTKKDGKEYYYPIHHSKLLILKLNLSNKKRIEMIKRKANLSDNDIEKLVREFSVSEDVLAKVKEINKSFK